ncbi:5-oxopent-3-ene-1,2,5-tricarboxylate decarboxylase/2-hydroxyhepta-2,4-diene-1,7-dioate isomerase [Scopulibacillus daqui]|uniref:5-oxopent-3-ene-1,2,5-tricarboxylate decarboxylase/2-hydroxyhepta-2,4-diene-1,7-dioate isomerase n=1 Tax=Scopulibacillus daqui TaxID=1469162 RepID=A0ABS2Q1E8_9BACL|nr:5-oxopent-3-ene-1,2,5-tricarboxylate decarboxylase/2-hydroxyhepta-2,4-diene-1,7-dioate isomerase [Scopulibacillus daqui]
MKKATGQLCGSRQTAEFYVNPADGTAILDHNHHSLKDLPWDIPVSGTIYGTALNYKGALAALGESVNEPPYQAPPKAPILYIKPANTIISCGMPIPLPEDITEVEIGAALGIVIGRTAVRVDEEQAESYIAGYTVVNDVSIPHESVYRPAVMQKCRDGFCPVGPWVIDRKAVTNPDDLNVRVFINGELKQSNNTNNLIRPVSRLISDVTEFMTLNAGDVLLVGVPENAPLAKKGDIVRIEIDEVGVLENHIASEKELVKEAVR